ncbi:MAG: aminotransferase class V-fold PLP-dependent enzyme [Acidimicrobiia bacterium]
MIDVGRLRADTPGVRNVAHLDNAGAALMPVPVVEAITGYLAEEATLGGYETRLKRSNEIETVYNSLANLIGAYRSEVALADNATRAWDLLFYSLKLRANDRIVTTTSEYVSNWAAYLHLRDTRGVTIAVAPDTPTGEIDVEALENMVATGATSLVAINHMPTNGGLVNPAIDVGDVTSRYGVPFLLDATQTVGQLPIDVTKIKCDMLVGTSRKYVRGPRGVGFLYVRDGFSDALEPVFVETENAPVVLPDRFVLASGAHRFETWEKAYALVIGFGTAIDYALETGIESIWQRVESLAATLRLMLDEIDGVAVYDLGSVKGGIVTFDVEGRQTLEVRELLSERNINVSTSSVFSSPLDMHERQIDGLVRASVHAYNDDEELERLAEAIRVIA